MALACIMGTSYSKAHRRKITRLLVVFLIIVSVLYTLHAQRSTQVASSKDPKAWAGLSQARNNAYTDEISPPLQQQRVRLGYGSPQNDGTHASEKEPSVPSSGASKKQSTIGKVTISFGEPDEVFDRAIRSHEFHNNKWGYPQFVLRERVMSGLWSKHAYIFSVIVQELAKPKAKRLQWIL